VLLPRTSNVLMATASCDDAEPSATPPTDRSTIPLVDSFVGNVNNQVVSPVDHEGPPVRGHLVFNACFEGGKYILCNSTVLHIGHKRVYMQSNCLEN
jgi:hypothetical protein